MTAEKHYLQLLARLASGMERLRIHLAYLVHALLTEEEHLGEVFTLQMSLERLIRFCSLFHYRLRQSHTIAHLENLLEESRQVQQEVANYLEGSTVYLSLPVEDLRINLDEMAALEARVDSLADSILMIVLKFRRR